MEATKELAFKSEEIKELLKPPQPKEGMALHDIPKAAIKEGFKLSSEKRKHPTKHYRLIYVIFGKPVLCAEDQAHYRKVNGPGGVIEAGEKLAGQLGITFDGRVR